MRAAVMRDRKLVVDEIPDLVPGPGQVLVKTLACGICGSDLHALKHIDRMVETGRRSGGAFVMDPARDIVMGHEFCVEVVEHGEGCQKTLKPGARACSIPVLIGAGGLSPVGYSNDTPGGFAEYMLLNEMMLLEVPNGLSTENAALTEPMAVGWHAVAKANLTPEDVPLVIGCGPVGLAVIAGLRIRGAAPIVAADFSPARRRLAEQMGAHVVVDPAEGSPYKKWEELAQPEPDAPATPFGPPALKPAAIFECVGVPGVLQQILEGASRGARVIVAGVCMEKDSIEPFFGINKELNLQFVLGYTPEEFAGTLRHLAEGEIVSEPLVTGKVGVEGVADAFEELASPERHAKILVEPWR
ncbi:MAG: zinc-binding dehydrogenase [Deltaproteobacteria bacterium]|nr:zinc-binding dehydrogenase [Deltaproteobacteria bacterium]MBW2415034.1 zinc-binding dehydrogenase [Deltaproteobacteria bacterium]